MLWIGVISDTHGLLRPEAVAALQGCDRIIHGGDVGKEDVLVRLRQIAPVWTVRGNVDRGTWAAELPPFLTVECEDVTIHILHDVHDLGLNPADSGVQVVISGHSHQPVVEERAGVMYLNPGSAGPRRFRLPVTTARLEVDGGRARIELVKLLD